MWGDVLQLLLHFSPSKSTNFSCYIDFLSFHAATMLALFLSCSGCENFIIGEFNGRDKIGIESTCKAIHCLRIGMKLARIFIAEDEVMKKMIRVFFFLQRCVEQGLWLVRADVIHKFANDLLASFQRVIANDKVGGLVNGHGAPPIM